LLYGTIKTGLVLRSKEVELITKSRVFLEKFTINTCYKVCLLFGSCRHMAMQVLERTDQLEVP